MLLRSLDGVVWFADLEGSLLYINNAVERVYGHSVSDFYRKTGLWRALVDPRDRGVVEQAAADLNEHGLAEVEYRIVRPDGRTVWIHDRKYVITDEFGTPQSLCGIAIDISDRRKAEEAARRANAMHADIRDLQAQFIAEASPKIVLDGLLRRAMPWKCSIPLRTIYAVTVRPRAAA